MERRGCLYAFLGALAIIVVSVIATTGAYPTSGGDSGGGPAVRDGKFLFRITRVIHARRVGSQEYGLGTKAQGEYTILRITVTNIASESQTFDDSAQYVYDERGRKFDASSQADLYINGGGDNAFLTDINPGSTVRVRIAFDLPKGDSAVKAELHGSMFSGGVTVSLR